MGYKEQFAAMSDEKLCEALVRKEYIPEAMEVAEAEFEKRNLDKALLAESTQKISDKDKELQDAPLGWGFRIFLFLVPFGLPQILIYQYYANQGAVRKAKEVWRWMAYGLIFYVSLGLLNVLTK